MTISDEELTDLIVGLDTSDAELARRVRVSMPRTAVKRMTLGIHIAPGLDRTRVAVQWPFKSTHLYINSPDQLGTVAFIYAGVVQTLPLPQVMYSLEDYDALVKSLAPMTEEQYEREAWRFQRWGVSFDTMSSGNPLEVVRTGDLSKPLNAVLMGVTKR